MGSEMCIRDSVVSVWRLILPVRFELDARGVQQICAGRRKFTPWNRFACYRFDSKGVILLHQHGSLALNALRGVYINAGNQRTQLESLLAFYLPMSDSSDSPYGAGHVD